MHNLVLSSLSFVVILGLLSCSQSDVARLQLLQSVAELPVNTLETIDLPLPGSDTPLLVEVRTDGVNLASQLLDGDGQVHSDVYFDYLRSVPQYHHIKAPLACGGLTLRLQPKRTNSAASVDVNIWAVPVSARSLNTAWRNLSRGQQRVDTLDELKWSKNLEALEAAQRGFDSLEMAEPALWAAYLAAYVQYFPLYQYPQAADRARRLLSTLESIEPDNNIQSLKTFTLLTHQLAGQILLESDTGLDANATESATELARSHFKTAQELALETGSAFEAIWAINNIGIAYFYEQQLEPALSHYSAALEQAKALDDTYLVGMVGGNVAVAQERMGHIGEAVQTLEDIQQRAVMQDSVMDQEYLLSLLGSYYLKLYRFPEALIALNQAMQLSDLLQSSENRGRNHILLGRVYREMGQTDKAETLAKLSIPELIAVDDQRGLRHAYRLLADASRAQAGFADMREERELEQEMLSSEVDQAAWLFSSASDREAEGQWQEASEQYRQSAALYAKSGFATWSNLAMLNACAAAIPLPAQPDCSIAQLLPRLETIQQVQAFAPAMQAKYAWVRLLEAQGDDVEALELTHELVAEIQYYRHSLPGILGAWYWDAREDLFSFYLQLISKSPKQQVAGKPKMLLALDQLRNSTDLWWPGAHPNQPHAAGSDAEQPIRKPLKDSDSDHLRELLVRRDQASSPEELIKAQRVIDNELIGRNLPHLPVENSEPVAEINDFLQELAQLPEDWSLLAYYLGGPTALAWVGDREGLKLIELGPSAPILQLVDQVKSTIRVYNEPQLAANLTALGQQLLQPVQSRLKFKLMVASSGALADLPLEALPVDGQALIKSHQIMNTQSVQRMSQSIAQAQSPMKPGKIFLAGFSDSPDSKLTSLPSTGRELQAVRSAFPLAETVSLGPHISGVDDFVGPAFQSADLIHLASHALIDRDYPELSRLALPSADSGESAYLMPSDFEGLSMSAKMTVLSACETVGLNHFDFDSHLGFVAQLLQHSNGLVVASLWPVADRITSDLMMSFYQELAAGSDIASSLRAAKLLQLETARPGDLSWAAFQLFSR